MEILQADGRDWKLQRYPLRHKEPLRPWDAADEYLLKHFFDEPPAGDPGRILLVNDAFGALAVALHAFDLTSWGDSYLGQLALRHNYSLNELPEPGPEFVPADKTPSGTFDTVLLKLPKSLAFWEDTLLRLRPSLSEDSRIVAGGMIKYSPARAYKLMESILGPTRTSQGWKKSRLAFTEYDAGLERPPILPDVEYTLPDVELVMSNRPNVFSRDHLDLGTRFLLPHLPTSASPLKIADLGCGNGAISLVLAKRNPEAAILGVDESYQAVACAQDNAERAGLAGNNLTFVVSDCLTEVDAGSLDLVVINPPFHQAQAVGDSIAWNMFNHARRTLKPGGRILVVGNRHLAYHVKLTRLFGGCRVVDSDRMFVVLEATRRRDVG